MTKKEFDDRMKIFSPSLKRFTLMNWKCYLGGIFMRNKA